MSTAGNDDKSPLIDLIGCIVCNQAMKLEKASPTLEEVTSFNIAAVGVTELSWCDYCAEIEICRTDYSDLPSPLGTARRTAKPSIGQLRPACSRARSGGKCSLVLLV